MNLHPLVIHFPIALRFFYCIILIVQFFKRRNNQKLNTIKHFCLLAGTIGGFFALQTGKIAADIYGQSPLIETHEERAEATFKLFLVLSLITVSTMQSWTDRFEWDRKIKKILTRMLNHRMMALAGIAGIISLTVVGALGGAITRGTNAGDPLSDWVVEILVP